MANHRTAAAYAASAADRRAAGQSEPTPPPVVEVTALCDLGQCARCPGEILSLLVPPGTRCGHACHQPPAHRAWREALAS